MSNFRVKLSPPTQELTLKNTTAVSTRLDNLSDISEPESAKVSGSVLVYNANTDSYVLSNIFTFDEEEGVFKIESGAF